MAFALVLPSNNAITSYGDLVAKVAARMDRDDLTADIATFVTLVEHYVNRELRVPDMEKTMAITCNETGKYPLPTDCIEVRSLLAPWGPLRGTSPGELRAQYYGKTGLSEAYALTGRVIEVMPNCGCELDLNYYERIPALTDTAPSNWLLDTHSDVYFYGCLLHAADHVGDNERAVGYSEAFSGAIARVSALGNRARHGGPIVARSAAPYSSGIRG